MVVELAVAEQGEAEERLVTEATYRWVDLADHTDDAPALAGCYMVGKEQSLSEDPFASLNSLALEAPCKERDTVSSIESDRRQNYF
jgi:hypothetical protein